MYETKLTENKGQELSLKDRKKLEITGVKKIESLNKEEFLVDTLLGLLLVKGNDLIMQQLDIDKGILWINGNIISLSYLDNEKKKEESFFKKLFKWLNR